MDLVGFSHELIWCKKISPWSQGSKKPNREGNVQGILLSIHIMIIVTSSYLSFSKYSQISYKKGNERTNEELKKNIDR